MLRTKPKLFSTFRCLKPPTPSLRSESTTATAPPSHTHRWHPPGDSTTNAAHDTNILIYNCVAKRKVPLILRHPNYATWYACGPTVYDASHIGHASCYVKQDIIQRTLRHHFRIPLVTAMNITDVDDKIIARSLRSRTPWRQLTARYESEFWSDLRLLRCAQPDVKLRVSEHMPQIVAFVQRLLRTSDAYATADGSVYFDVSRATGYGKLQRLSSGDTNVVVDSSSSGGDQRQQQHEGKRSDADFALWKGRDIPANAELEPHWSVPWSRLGGRPGWHIECSAMATHLFGSCVDFHAGGLDLRFPHHENEEAQSCAYHRCEQWVNYWVHVGQLHVVGETDKMSKSLGNTVGVAELLKRYDAVDFRMLCLLSNYQNAIEFGADGMSVATAIVKRLDRFEADCEAFCGGRKRVGGFEVAELLANVTEAERRIDEALRNNFDTSKSVECLMELLTQCNRMFKVDGTATMTASPNVAAILAVKRFVGRYRDMWGLERDEQHGERIERNDDDRLDRVVENVLQARQSIRTKAVASKQNELFAACDTIRDALGRAGVRVEDGSGGMSTWTIDATKRVEVEQN